MSEVEALVAQLRMGDDDRAESASVALGRLGEAALPSLETLLASKQVDDRWWAVRAIAAMDNPPTDLLRAGLRDRAVEVRAASALALSAHPAAAAVPDLIDALGDADYLVSTLCVQALIRLGSACVAELVEAFPSARSLTRPHIMRALAGIKDPEAIRTMLAATEDDSAIVAYWAREGLDALGLGMVYLMPE